MKTLAILFALLLVPSAFAAPVKPAPFDLTKLEGDFDSYLCVDNKGYVTPSQYMTTITVSVPDQETVKMQNHKWDASVPTEDFKRINLPKTEGPFSQGGLCIIYESASMASQSFTIQDGVFGAVNVTLRKGHSSYTQTRKSTLTLTPDGVRLSSTLETRYSFFERSGSTQTCYFRRK